MTRPNIARALDHAQQAVANLEAALRALDADGASEAAKLPYRQNLDVERACVARLQGKLDAQEGR